MKKYQNFLSENFHFLVGKLSVYLNRRVFVMAWYKRTSYTYHCLIDWLICEHDAQHKIVHYVLLSVTESRLMVCS